MTSPKVEPRRERWAEPETLYDAIEGTVHDTGIPPKALAEEMHLGLGDLYDLANPSRQRPLKVAQLIPLMKLTRDFRILQFLAVRCGFLLVRLPPAEVGQGEAFQLARDVMRECAEAIEVFAVALEDGRVTPDEARAVATQCDDGIAALTRVKLTAEAQTLLADLSMACRQAIGQRPAGQ